MDVIFKNKIDHTNDDLTTTTEFHISIGGSIGTTSPRQFLKSLLVGFYPKFVVTLINKILANKVVAIPRASV
jgi:hypothetical protein